jgi:hypothetical protein
LKVAILLPGFHMGGVERWALQVRNAFELLGYEADILVTGSITENSHSFKYNFEIKKISFIQLFNLEKLYMLLKIQHVMEII